ncbi:MAG: iron ABC transporter permease [Proteobacteria bacterium]|nr:MAG: iron ABC transporter permease [Pseudomonadota bacterium]
MLFIPLFSLRIIQIVTLRYPVFLVLLLAAAIAATLWSLSTGSMEIAPGEIIGALANPDSRHGMVVHELRLPRTVGGFLAGSLLALTGAILQVLLRNPLADPYVLGISGGASVAALAVIMVGASASLVMGAAAAGAGIATALVFLLAYGRGVWSSTRLLLTGVVLASGWGALISFMLSLSRGQEIHSMLFWLMGDLAGSRPGPGSLAVLLVGFAVCAFHARDMNLLSGGEMRAQSLGVAVNRLRITLFLCASAFTAAAVVLAGTIGFVGLVVPHMMRLIAGGDHRGLLPASALCGGALVVFADTLARTVIAPQQPPVGVVTALIGVPLFLVLLRKTLSAGLS